MSAVAAEHDGQCMITSQTPLDGWMMQQLAGTWERKAGEGNEKRRILYGLNDPMTRNNIY